jgi:hypothetical protein
MARTPKKQQQQKHELLMPVIKTTRDLRIALIQSFEDLMVNRITPQDARARSIVARAILDTVRVELVLARANLSIYRTIDLIANQETNADVKG